MINTSIYTSGQSVDGCTICGAKNRDGNPCGAAPMKCGKYRKHHGDTVT